RGEVVSGLAPRRCSLDAGLARTGEMKSTALGPQFRSLLFAPGEYLTHDSETSIEMPASRSRREEAKDFVIRRFSRARERVRSLTSAPRRCSLDAGLARAGEMPPR